MGGGDWSQNLCEVLQTTENLVLFFLFFKMRHNKDNTCLSKERLTTLIREIFRVEFEKQQKNLLNLISGNLKNHNEGN